MFYQTTRNFNAQKTFAEIVCLSNAPCGGLYIPSVLPSLKKESFNGMNYAEIAEEIISIFTEISRQDIASIVGESVKNFTSEKIFQVQNFENLTIAELFHGPTLSFKDYPMQFLGNIVEYILARSDKKLNILTATSGDTGSAAIHAFANKENIRIAVLHPKGKVTPFQRKQMTTNSAKNVLNIAIDGTFDDCQNIVKKITNSKMAEERSISTVNSINWGRIMMQMVYYIKILQARTNVSVFVPTGNFGNIFACYFLKKCGFEGISKLFISNNVNNVIEKTHKTGLMKNQKTLQTLSPAIDISIPSNFERMLFLESGAEQVQKIYGNLQNIGNSSLDENLWQRFRNHFETASISDAKTLEIMRDFYKKHGYILDPHTAVAVAHSQSVEVENQLVIATAHPCKFEDAVFQAIGKKAKIPDNNLEVLHKSEMLEEMPLENVEEFVMDFF